jgi:hypothetical protein
VLECFTQPETLVFISAMIPATYGHCKHCRAPSSITVDR